MRDLGEKPRARVTFGEERSSGGGGASVELEELSSEPS